MDLLHAARSTYWKSQSQASTYACQCTLYICEWSSVKNLHVNQRPTRCRDFYSWAGSMRSNLNSLCAKVGACLYVPFLSPGCSGTKQIRENETSQMSGMCTVRCPCTFIAFLTVACIQTRICRLVHHSTVDSCDAQTCRILIRDPRQKEGPYLERLASPGCPLSCRQVAPEQGLDKQMHI